MKKNSVINGLLLLVVVILIYIIYNLNRKENFNTKEDDEEENSRYTNYTLNSNQFVNNKLKRPFEPVCSGNIQCK
jgi:hypothetical protein